MSPKLAASMRPLARAFETPSRRRVRPLMKRKGSAPIPVATAVSSASRKTCATPGACRAISVPVVLRSRQPFLSYLVVLVLFLRNGGDDHDRRKPPKPRLDHGHVLPKPSPVTLCTDGKRRHRHADQDVCPR